LNDLLALLVQGRGCLIEDQNRRILDEGTSNGDSLFLTSRELLALDSAFLIEALVELKLPAFTLLLNHAVN